MTFAVATPGPKRRVREGLESALYWSGVAAVFARARRPAGAVILMYHSITTAESRRFTAPRNGLPEQHFAAQMAFLARHRRVVPLEYILTAIERGQVLPSGTVAITFDDGYRDNLEIAAPILARHALPATLYLATGYVTAARNQWLDELYATFLGRTRHELALADVAGLPAELRAPEAAERAYDRLAAHLLVASFEERARVLADVSEQLRAPAPPPRLTLEWREVGALLARYPDFTVGLHTHGHTDLTACDRDTAARELTDCREEFSRRTGREAVHFSFPYGRSNASCRELVASSGLTSAVVTDPVETVTADSDRFALPRLEVTANATRLRLWTSGACPALPRLLFGRA